MAVVVFAKQAFVSGTLPPICVVTGLPATSNEPRTAKSPVGALWFLLLLGILPFVLARVLTVKRAEGFVPYNHNEATSADEYLRRRKRRFTTGWCIAILGFGLMVGGLTWHEASSVGPQILSWSGAALAALSFGIFARASRSPLDDVGFEVSSGGDRVTIQNAHPTFVSAMTGGNTGPPLQPLVPTDLARTDGWHPDPIGRGRLRYWDGVRWTPHLIGHDGQTYHDPV